MIQLKIRHPKLLLGLIVSSLLMGVSSYLAPKLYDRLTYLNDTTIVDKNNNIHLPPSTIVLEGPVTNGLNTRIFPRHIDLRIALERVKSLVDNGDKDIVIVIDSPGGDVDAVSETFIGYLEFLGSRGVRTHCIVDGRAESLGMVIHSRCSHRYATVGSKLLWHSANIDLSEGINVFEAERLVTYMHELNERLWAPVASKMFPWFFNKYFKADTPVDAILLHANSFGYLGIVNRIFNRPVPVLPKRATNGIP